jgi:hypothetical protein
MTRRRLRAHVNWAVRWGGALVCLAVLIAYAVGCFLLVRVSYRKSIQFVSLELARGQMRLVTTDWLSEGGGGSSELRPHGLELRVIPMSSLPDYAPTWAGALRVTLVHGGAYGPFAADYEVRIPLWSVFVAGALASGVAIRSHRRLGRAPGTCPSCHYDLSGLPPNSPCPECASPPNRPKA